MGNPIFIEPKEIPYQKVISVSPQHNGHSLPHLNYSQDHSQDHSEGERHEIINHNEHPVRRFLNRNISRREEIRASNQEIDDTVGHSDDLEDMIIRQLRPRSFSLLFGNNDSWQQDNLENQSMETVMSRLRRQLRNSTARLAQEVSLTHRNQQRLESVDSRERLEMDRMIRRARQERRSDNMLFHSAFYRWNMARGDETQQHPREDVQVRQISPGHPLSQENMARQRVRRYQLNHSVESNTDRQSPTYPRITQQSRGNSYRDRHR
jgi:hypothetical protein